MSPLSITPSPSRPGGDVSRATEVSLPANTHDAQAGAESIDGSIGAAQRSGSTMRRKPMSAFAACGGGPARPHEVGLHVDHRTAARRSTRRRRPGRTPPRPGPRRTRRRARRRAPATSPRCRGDRPGSPPRPPRARGRVSGGRPGRARRGPSLRRSGRHRHVLVGRAWREQRPVDGREPTPAVLSPRTAQRHPPALRTAGGGSECPDRPVWSIRALRTDGAQARAGSRSASSSMTSSKASCWRSGPRNHT